MSLDAQVPASTGPHLQRTLGMLDLALLNVTALVSFRWLSIAAQVGPSSLVLWILGALTFLVPSALTVLELNARYPDEGGLYVWSKAAFGDLHSFIVGWCYWIANLVFFPSLLIFIADVLLYIGGPRWQALAENHGYTTGICLGALWLVTALNVLGLGHAKWLQNAGGVATWLAAIAIFVGGALALHEFGSSTPFHASSLVPQLTSLPTLGSFAAMALAYVGLELGPIMGSEIKSPQRTVGRAMLIACIAVPAVYILSTAALLVALPAEQINLISGIPQALNAVGNRIGVPAIGPVAAALVVLSQIGTLGAWVGGTARLPFLFGLNRYLPRALGTIHPTFGSPYVALLTQGVLTTLVLLAALSGSVIHEAFQVLIDIDIILSFIPLIYMFAALPVLRMRAGENSANRIPGGTWVCWVVSAVAIAVTALGAFVAMIPPYTSANRALIALKVIGGAALMIAIGLLFYFTGRRRLRSSASRGPGYA